MKNIIYLVFAVTSFQFIEAMTEKEAIEALETFADSCDPKPTEEDMKNIIRNEENVPKSTKCFRRCLINNMEMMKDCKLDGEKLKGVTAMIAEDKDKETDEITLICNAKITSCEDECEAAHSHGMCLMSEFKSRKWPMPELEKE